MHKEKPDSCLQPRIALPLHADELQCQLKNTELAQEMLSADDSLRMVVGV